MATNNVDTAPYSELLTAFAVERGSGGGFIADQIAIPTVVETQEYAIPNFESAVAKIGTTQTAVRGDGSLSVREGMAPSFNPGKCSRRGVKGYIDDEVAAGPHADLFANETVEVQDNLNDLQLEMELKVKTALDAVKSTSLHNISPSVKWDGGSDPLLINVIEAAARQAELNSGKSLASGNWRLVVPDLVADVVKDYLRTKLLYTDSAFQANGILPKSLANIPVIGPGAFQNTAAQGQTASLARIWSSDDVYLVYVDPSFANSRRTYTALAQMRWNKVSPSYAVKVFRDKNQDVNRTWVATDIYDNLETISNHGIYVIKHVLTVQTT